MSPSQRSLLLSKDGGGLAGLWILAKFLIVLVTHTQEGRSNILGAKPIENNPNIKITNNFNVSEQKSLEYNLIEYKKIKYILANDSKKSIYKYELNKSNYKGILLGYLNKKNKIKFFKK